MAPSYPYRDDPERFSEWLYSRLQSIPDITWDKDDKIPVHTSYEDWNIWGALTESAFTSKSDPPSPNRTAQPSRPRPPLIRLPSRDSNQKVVEKVQRKIKARVSLHALRLERQYQIIKALDKVDPLGERHVRALQLLRLPPREGHDEPSLLVLLLEDSEGFNKLRRHLNYGPGWYLLDQLPAVYPYNPSLTSDGAAGTGQTTMETFLNFARGATECCIMIHDKSMIHGEIRPDALHFGEESGIVRWINHGAGLRSFESGLTGAAWTAVSQMYGVSFNLNFLAPEQTGRLSGSPDNRTDLYSLGVVFYLMLTGETPFQGTTALEVLQSMLSRRVPRVATKRIDLPQAISAVVSKMVQRNIEDRYHSAHGLLWDLEEIARLHHDYLANGDDSPLQQFEPATQDANCVFRVPDSLVGREHERDKLLTALNDARERQKLVRSKTAHKSTSGEDRSVNGVAMRPSSVSSGTESDGASDRSKSVSSMGLGDLRRPYEATPNRSMDTNGNSAGLGLARTLSVEGSSSFTGVPSSSQNDSYGPTCTTRGPDKTSRYSKTDVITISGASGQGKSKLVASVLSDSRKDSFVATAKFDGASSMPFQPMIALMSALFRQIVMVDRQGSDQLRKDLEYFVQPVWGALSCMLSLPLEMFSSSVPHSTKPQSDEAVTVPERRSPISHVLSQGKSDTSLKPNPLVRSSTMDRCKKATGFLRTGSASKSSRFQAMYISILRFICRSHSIVFALEDIESADPESLELLASTLTSKTPLTFILTSRGLDEGNSVARNIDKFAVSTTIELLPLDEDAISDLLAHTLHRGEGYCALLTAFSLQKSKGNPFALRTFLEDCHKRQYIWYDWADRLWKYNLDSIIHHFGSPDVRLGDDFIAEQLAELPMSSRQILSWAALLGSPFRFSLVKTLIQAHSRGTSHNSGKHGSNPDLVRESSQDTVRGLETLLHSSILLATEFDDLFEFCHREVRMAAKKLVECNRKDEMHFRISQALLVDKFNEGADVFSHACHICACVKIVKKLEERRSYREILQNASNRLTESQSKKSRLKYLSNALTLLQDFPWEDHQPDSSYAETLLLHIQASEAYARMDYLDPALRLIDTTLENAKNVFDKVPSFILKSKIQVQQGQVVEAFCTLRTALSDFRVVIQDCSWEHCDRKFEAMKRELEDLALDELDTRPSNEDPSLMAISELFSEGLMLAFWVDGQIYYSMSLMFLELMLQRGITAHSAQALGNVASCIIGRFDLVELGVKLGMIGERLYDKFNDDDYATGKGLGYHTMQIAWLHQPIKSMIPKFDNAMERSLAANDRNNSLMNAGFATIARIWASYDATDVEAYTQYIKEIIDWEGDLRGGILLTAAAQYAKALTGKTRWHDHKTILSDDEHDSTRYLKWTMSHSTTPQRISTNYAQFQLPALYIYGHIEAAIDLAEKELLPLQEKYWSFVSRVAAQTAFYISLSYLAACPFDAIDSLTKSRVDYAERTLICFQIWSQVSDVNLLPWTSLIRAILQERKGQVSEAVQSYETALDHAEVHSQTFEYALVNEHYAEFLVRRKANRLARHAMRDAAAAYRRLHYVGKAKHIASKHEWLLTGTNSLSVADAGCQTDHVPAYKANPTKISAEEITTEVASHGTSMPTDLSASDGINAGGLDVVDVSNILQSSQILASTLNIDELLRRMADVMLTSSGAELAAIVTSGDGNDDWIVSAISDTSGCMIPGGSLNEVDDYVGKHITLYALRFRETVFVDNIYDDQRFADVADAYRHKNPEGKAVFASPIIRSNHLLGAVYVETAPHSFTSRSLTVLQSLLSSVSISIANANLFKKLERSNASNKALIDSQKQAITEARESEGKAKEAREEALESLKLKEEAAKAKSLFLANTSHELRTPLNGVIGMSELLKGSNLSSEQAGYADSIRVCADTLLQVINDILDFSKLEAGKLQLYSVPLFLHQTIEEVIRAISYSNQGRDVETITRIQLSPQLVVNGDPVRLHQLLMNLLSNAYKFTSQGSITIKAVIEDESSTDVDVVVSVEDTGIGIDENNKKKLFIPFAQADNSTSRSYGGTGLGLSICKAIVETMGGTIWLESEKGKGSTVSFQLKLAKVLKGKTSVENKPQANPIRVFTPDEGEESRRLGSPVNDLSMLPKEKIRIAIAEDNMVNQKIAIKFVQKLGYPCEAFADGLQTVEALEKAAETSQPFMIVLMDCQMPRLDGYDATRQIRRHDNSLVKDVVIIALTASAIRGDYEKCLSAGMSNYLAKPVKQDMLRQMLDHYVKPHPPTGYNTPDTNGHSQTPPPASLTENHRPTSAPGLDLKEQG